MKREILAIALSCGVLLSACADGGGSTYTIKNTSLDKPSATATASPSPTPTVEPVVFTQDYLDEIQKKMAGSSYIELSQLVSNKSFNEDNTEGATNYVNNFQIGYDAKEKVYEASIKVTDATLGSDTLSVKCDFKNHKFYKKDGDKWVSSEKSGVVLSAFGDKGISTTYGVYTKILGDFLPEIGAKGEERYGGEVFTTTRDAIESDIGTGKYDKLLTTIIRCAYKDGLPTGVERETTFELDGKKHSVSTMITIDELSDKTLRVKSGDVKGTENKPGHKKNTKKSTNKKKSTSKKKSKSSSKSGSKK